MKIGIIGGKLQGVEAAYLALKAEWEVILIDKDPDVPASGLSDIHVQMDINETDRLNSILRDVELVIPATENTKTLNALEQWSRASSIPLAFDAPAYRISSSKLESDRIFSSIGIPVPESWPHCRFPVVAKPSNESGSKGVRIFQNRQQLEELFPGSLPPSGWVFQEYIEGPSYSLEIVGTPGNYETLQVTDLEMDAGYDCKRVSAPSGLSVEQIDQFRMISIQIAEVVQLHGLMDVEVILHKNKLKVLEIDARLPSQTPTVVYQSSGSNILEILHSTDSISFQNPPIQKGVIYEHIKVTSGALEICGEHIMAEAGVLHLCKDFFGADEAITNYVNGKDDWVATLIITGQERRDAWEKRNQVVYEIQKYFKLVKYTDPTALMDDEC